MPVGALLDRRNAESSKRLHDLKTQLKRAETLCAQKACVYVTGSFGRGEASAHSDLDVFIAGKSSRRRRAFTRLNEILVKADLIESTKKLGIPEFSGDGEYLQHYTLDQIVRTLGKPEDDASNTFTARLLLLLESRPLLEAGVYSDVINNVISAYWRDYHDHETDFVPAFLANDILRLWRTFCVNYEARTSDEPPSKKAKRKLKNYKLKHSRLLTCYSALLYLSAVYSKFKTVRPDDAVHMISLTPTQRLKWLLEQKHLRRSHAKVRKLLSLYEAFLRRMDAPEAMLVKRFRKSAENKQYRKHAYEFGDLTFEVLDSIGQNNRFHRLLVV